jgi:hypothetical protein
MDPAARVCRITASISVGVAWKSDGTYLERPIYCLSKAPRRKLQWHRRCLPNSRTLCPTLAAFRSVNHCRISSLRVSVRYVSLSLWMVSISSWEVKIRKFSSEKYRKMFDQKTLPRTIRCHGLRVHHLLVRLIFLVPRLKIVTLGPKTVKALRQT